jgi:hypothetical protein
MIRSIRIMQEPIKKKETFNMEEVQVKNNAKPKEGTSHVMLRNFPKDLMDRIDAHATSMGGVSRKASIVYLLHEALRLPHNQG